MTLTQEEKNIKICEYLGWTQIRGGTGFPPGSDSYQLLPNHFNDLNAMHEAEKALGTKEVATRFASDPWNRYERYLACAVAADDKDQYWTPLRTIESVWFCAKSHHRAEAFGKTLSLW